MKKILLTKTAALIVMNIVFFALPDFLKGQGVDTTYKTSTTVTIPDCITSITVEAWGGGGGGGKGGTSENDPGAGGGGGGAYTRIVNYSVNPGQNLIITVGEGGAGSELLPNPGLPGGNSSVVSGSTTICLANGGSGGTSGNSGLGGAGGNTYPSGTSYAGGSGANGGGLGSNSYGGGGGGSAGSLSNGISSTSQTGAESVTDGGPGGNGGKNSSGSDPNNPPGGGGGGGEYGGFGGYNGGDGANGQVRITYHINPTISLGNNPFVCQGITVAELFYTNITGCPDQYSIDYDETANSAGFTDVTNGSLGGGQINLLVPPGATPGTYSGTLNVKNSTLNVSSIDYPITVTVHTLPSVSTPAATPVSYCQNGTATPLSVTGTAGSGTISSYAWYSNTTQSNSGGTLLEIHTTSSTTDTYTPLTTTPGTLYYYVVITDSYGCTETSDASGAVTINTDGIWTGAGDNSTWEDPLNWCGGVPTTGKIVIPVGASVHITADPDNPSTCTNLVIDGTLTIDAGKALTVTDILTNNGSLILNSYDNNTPDNPDDDGIASLIAGNYADEGFESIGLFLSGGSWHYISTPIQNLSANIFAVGNDLAQYVESRPTIASPYSFQRGWIAWDGWSYYDYPYDVYVPASSFSTLNLGKGYNYWNLSDANFTLVGSINTDGPLLSLANSGNATYSGYNLIGNPFTSGLDIQAMFNGAWPSGINKAVYFTSGGSYYVFGDDINVPETDQSQIPPMQGFFVRATSGGTYNLPWVKAHTSEPRFKGEKSSVPHVRLSISANGKSEETVVRFNENAKPGSDTEFDVPRFFTAPNSPSIYTTLGEIDFTINGLPFPETKVDIPVIVNLLTDGNHTITAMKVEELNNYKVTFTDKSTGSSMDLNSGKKYSFSAPAGLIKDRFVLTVSNLSTAIEDPVNVDNLFNIYSGFDLINIQPLSDQWDGKTGSVKLLDISGKTVRNQPNTEFMKNSLIQLPSPGNGIYFVEIRSGIMRYVGKVVVK